MSPNRHNLTKVLNNIQNTDEMLNESAEKSITYLIKEKKITKEKYFEHVQESATPDIQIEAYYVDLITMDEIDFTNFSDDNYSKLLSKTKGQFEISVEKYQQIYKKLIQAFDKMKWTPHIVLSEEKLKVSVPTERVISSAVDSFNEAMKSNVRNFIDKKIKGFSENAKKFIPCYSTMLYTGAFAFTLSNALFRFNKWGRMNSDSRNKLYGILFCVGIPMTFGGIFGKNNAIVVSGFSLAISANYLETYYNLSYDTTKSLHVLLQLIGYASICSGLYKVFMFS